MIVRVFSDFLSARQRPMVGFVRLCRRRNELVTIVNEARACRDGKWDIGLIDRVKTHILGGATSGISVYALQTLSPFDRGHALGVIAEGIDQDKLRSTYPKRDRGITRGTLLIPIKTIATVSKFRYTPKANLNFSPADTFHYDIEIREIDVFCISLLNGLRDGSIKAVFLGNDKKLQGSYMSQSRIAYSYCLQKYGLLDPSRPPQSWTSGTKLDAKEQIDSFQFLVDLESAHSMPS